MHGKSDSEATSLAASSPPRSPRRPVYYVVSPSNHDTHEKLSVASTPPSSPFLHHSRESSNTRFSAPFPAWKRLPSPAPRVHGNDDDDEEEEEEEERPYRTLDPRCYALLFALSFSLLFSLFSFLLWGCSKAYPPHISVLSITFDTFNLHAGMDDTGVPTKMLSLNSTLRFSFHNTATFFGVHVTFTPLDLYYFQLKVASGSLRGFYQRRRSSRVVAAAVGGEMVPLYGGGAEITSRADGDALASIPLTLEFLVRSRAHVLGRLVRSKFYVRVRCSALLRESWLGRPVLLGKSSCEYHRRH